MVAWQGHWIVLDGKSAVAERFIRTLNNKILKHMTMVSKKCIKQKARWNSWQIQQYISQNNQNEECCCWGGYLD